MRPVIRVLDDDLTARIVEEAKRVLADLESLDLSLDKATAEVEVEGVESFSKSIHAVFDTIEERSRTLVA